MERVLPFIALLAFLVVWSWFLHRSSNGRWHSPLWLAFTTTASAILFIVAGSFGYTLDRHTRFVDGTPWAGAVVWPQVALGVALVPLAAFLWRRGLRSLAHRR